MRVGARGSVRVRDVVEVPGGGLDGAEEDDGGDARLQRQQLRAMAQAEDEPHHAQADVGQGERAEEG